MALYWLKLGERVTTISTVGLNVETVEYNGLGMTMRDVSGPRLWQFYTKESEAVIYVVDAADRDRIAEATAELQRVMGMEGMEDCPLLVFANKQDQQTALSAAQLAEEMKVADIAGGRAWHCQGTSAISGQGLYEGMDWMTERLKERRRE